MRILLLGMIAAATIFCQESSYRWIRRLGGSGEETVAGVAVDAAGNTYIAGSTNSADFPVKNAWQARPGGTPLFRVGEAGASKVYGTGTTAIQAVALSPCEPLTVYAVGDKTLLRSSDAGDTWAASVLPSVTFAYSVAVACEAVSPVIYVSYERGLLRSRDLSHWEALPLDGGTVYRVWADPSAANILYARTARGLARSVDAGNSWQWPGVSTFDVTFDAGRPGTLYASLLLLMDGGPAIRAIVPGRSEDYGATWTELAALPGREYPQLVVADPERPGVLYALGAIFFVSTDRGLNWSRAARQVRGPVAIDRATNTIYGVSDAGMVVATNDGFATVRAVSPAGLPAISSIAVSQGRGFVSANGTRDVFLAKLDPEGEVLWSTYLGGANEDTATAIAVDEEGAICLTGRTVSLDFPGTPGAYQQQALSQGAVFVARFRADGRLAWATHFQGDRNNYTEASAIASVGGGAVLIAGTTQGGIPATAGSYQPQFQGQPLGGAGSIVPLPPPTNGFAAKLRSDGSGIEWATYLGRQNDGVGAMAVARDGSIYAGGPQNVFHLSGDGARLLRQAGSGGQSILAMARDGSDGLYTAGANFGSYSFTLMKWTENLERGTAQLLPGVTGVSLSLDRAGKLLLSGGATPLMPTRAPLQAAFSPLTGFVSVRGSDLSTEFATFSGDRHIFSVGGSAAAMDGDIAFAGSTRPVFANGGYYPFAPAADDAASADVFAARFTFRQPGLRLDAVVNAASGVANPLAENETVEITGWGFGGDVQVLADDQGLAILSVEPGRIVAVVPAGFDGGGTVRVEAISRGERSNSLLALRAAASPGIYVSNGQPWILNADGTRNTHENPSAGGERVTIFATGVTPGGEAVANFNGKAGISGDVVLERSEGLPGQVCKLGVVAPSVTGPVNVQVVAGGVGSQLVTAWFR